MSVDRLTIQHAEDMLEKKYPDSIVWRISPIEENDEVEEKENRDWKSYFREGVIWSVIFLIGIAVWKWSALIVGGLLILRIWFSGGSSQEEEESESSFAPCCGSPQLVFEICDRGKFEKDEDEEEDEKPHFVAFCPVCNEISDPCLLVKSEAELRPAQA